jgi:hypothetical protein
MSAQSPDDTLAVAGAPIEGLTFRRFRDDHDAKMVVDTENTTGTLPQYERLGFRPTKCRTPYCKPLG